MMTKDEIKKKIDELGIIYVADVNNWQMMEDVIKSVEESNKSPQMIAAPLIIDGETDRKLFNTREKILAYFIKKNIIDISMQREILREVMGSNQTFYSGAVTEEQKLEWDIAMYLTYKWVELRQKH